MRLARSPKLDALCGEYIVGTLRGGARRRFEQMLRDDPLVAHRLRYWQMIMTPKFSDEIEIKPSPSVWKGLERELGLARYRPSLLSRLSFWRGWAVASTAALAIVLGLTLLQPAPETQVLTPIAHLQAAEPGAAGVRAALSEDGRTLALRAERPVQAGAGQSFELWLIPAGGGAPLSMAVVAQLDASLRVPDALVGRLGRGATLAISVEPPGGSPTGAPTGPVILVGKVEAG